LKGYRQLNEHVGVYNISYFSDREKDYVYKARVFAYGNELTGIFIAKKLDDTTHRVVFATEFGNKLLDFEISENGFKVNSIVEEMDRKLLIHILKKDFRLLLRPRYQISKQLENASAKVYVAKHRNDKILLFTTSDGKLAKIVNASGRKAKTNISFTSIENTIAEQITIQHSTILLKIELDYMGYDSK
jgi:hypothetical protein